MNPRQEILGRIREALRVPAPRPGHAHNDAARENPAAFRPLLPSVPATAEERLAMFRAKASELKADFGLVATQQEMLDTLKTLSETERWQKIGSHRGALADQACAALALPICHTDAPYKVNDLESCSAGISECDALVAQTGSVLVTSCSAGGRALSALPPHHVVLARRDQLVADLPEAFALLKQRYSKNYPSFISFITGPSRTGDIERILVLGAHGPKKLTIVCLN